MCGDIRRQWPRSLRCRRCAARCRRAWFGRRLGMHRLPTEQRGQQQAASEHWRQHAVLPRLDHASRSVAHATPVPMARTNCPHGMEGLCRSRGFAITTAPPDADSCMGSLRDFSKPALPPVPPPPVPPPSYSIRPATGTQRQTVAGVATRFSKPALPPFPPLTVMADPEPAIRAPPLPPSHFPRPPPGNKTQTSCMGSDAISRNSCCRHSRLHRHGWPRAGRPRPAVAAIAVPVHHHIARCRQLHGVATRFLETCVASTPALTVMEPATGRLTGGPPSRPPTTIAAAPPPPLPPEHTAPTLYRVGVESLVFPRIARTPEAARSQDDTHRRTLHWRR